MNSKESQTPTHFWETGWANPKFREDQRAVIDGLTVGYPADILPPALIPIYERVKDKPGDKKIDLPGGQFIHTITTDNNTVVIRLMKKIRPLSVFFPIHRIKSFHMIDALNDKAWDVSELWNKPRSSEKGKESKPVEVVNTPAELNASFVPTKNMDLLILNRLTSDHWLGRLIRWLKPKNNEFEVMDNIIPPHEAGHRFQIQDISKTSDNLPSKPNFGHKIQAFFLPLVEKIFPSWGETLRKNLTRIRRFSVEMERNANAFSLAVVRKLNDMGLNLLRGFDKTIASKTVEWMLGTYDKGFGNIPGPLFSHTDKIMRKRIHDKAGHTDDVKSVETETNQLLGISSAA